MSNSHHVPELGDTGQLLCNFEGHDKRRTRIPTLNKRYYNFQISLGLMEGLSTILKCQDLSAFFTTRGICAIKFSITD
jgi:hypothetical protein